MTAQVRLEVKPDTPFFYVNYIAVSHSQVDFVLSGARVPLPLLPEQIEFAKKSKQTSKLSLHL